MTEYIVTTDTPPEVMEAKGADVITRCEGCDNYFAGYCNRIIDGKFGRFRVDGRDYCSWAVPSL